MGVIENIRETIWFLRLTILRLLINFQRKVTPQMKTILAISAIFGLEARAIYNGINGALLGFAIASIAGLGGYAFKGKKRL